MITQKLYNLATAIKEFEGWKPYDIKSQIQDSGSQSYQNHNPGNLRKSPFALGERNNFAYFLNDDIGFWSLLWDLWEKAHGATSTGLTGESTIADLIRTYSASPPNVLENYIKHIENKTGMSRDTQLKNLI